jgi:hypothetical protein
MTQVPNYTVENSSGIAFRSQLNELFKAIQSMNSGVSAPADAVAHMLWYDTTNNVPKVRNAANTDWIPLLEYLGFTTAGSALVTAADAEAQRSALGLPAQDFVSADLTFATGAGLLVAHGLGGVPKDFKVWLKCVTAEHGFIVGSKTKAEPFFASVWYNIQAYVTQTDVGLIIMSAGVSIVSPLGQSVLLTPANWRIVVEASL